MRLWNLSQLSDSAEKEGFPNRLIIHTCEKCGWRTPISPNLNSTKKYPIWHDSLRIEYNQGYCDKCNIEFWDKVRNAL